MTRALLLLALGLLFAGGVAAQAVTVRVLARPLGGGAAAPLEGAWAYAPETGQGARTGADGLATVPNAGSTRTVTVNAPGYTGDVVAAMGGETVSALLLRGDVDGDGTLSLVDVAALVDLTGRARGVVRPGTPAFDPAFDFAADGRIDSLDVAAVASVASRTGRQRSYALLDDAETPDAAATPLLTGAFWSVLSDAAGGGSTATAPASGTALGMMAGGAYGSAFAARYTYTLGARGATGTPFALMRLNLSADASEGLDLRGYEAIEFWLKGNGVPLVVSLRTGATGDGAEYAFRIAAAPGAWTRYQVAFSTLRQPGGTSGPAAAVLADVRAIQFKTDSGVAGEAGEVWADGLVLRAIGGGAGRVDGTAVSPDGAVVPYARVTLTGRGVPAEVLADAAGRFAFEGVLTGTYAIRAERGGYTATTVSGLVVAPGPAATPRVEIPRTVPAVKPRSTGPARVVGRRVEADYDGDGAYVNYRVKGAAYSVSAIGTTGLANARYHGRGMRLLRDANATTVRTYSGADRALLDSAAAYGIRVIVGFFPGSQNFALPAVRRSVANNFRAFVRTYRAHPAVLMYTLGNEQNLPGNGGDNPFWYSLTQELAMIAYEEEGAGYHPVSISNGDFNNIGSAAKAADDASLTYVDLWASNIYQLNLAPRFATIRTATQKPLVLTEFGIDALDHRTRTEYEATQAAVDERNWFDIEGAADVCVGGTVFEFTDEWWKGGTPSAHDFGGYATNQHPDGFSNEEWWGLVRIGPDTNGDGLDEWTPRAAYFAFQRLWR